MAVKRNAYTQRIVVSPPRGPRPDLAPDCPNKANHQLGPHGYLNWHDWAERMSETHDQSQCPGCGQWVLWAPKPTNQEKRQ